MDDLDKQWYQRNKKHKIQKSLGYYYKNQDKIKAKRKIQHRETRKELFQLLGTECVQCGFSDIRALQLDHKNGHGYDDRKKFKLSGTLLYQFYLKNPELAKEKLQVLCANCNWIKRDENNENANVN